MDVRSVRRSQWLQHPPPTSPGPPAPPGAARARRGWGTGSPRGWGYGAAMHLKRLQWGQSVPLHVAVSLHAWLPGQGRGPRGEAETVTRAGAGSGQPGLYQGEGVEPGGWALHRGRQWPLCLSARRGGQEARPPGRAQVSPGLGGPRTVHRAAVINAPWGQSWENPGTI